VVLGFPRTVLSTTANAVDVDGSRAIPYSNHGVERETRLELATLTLARYMSNSVFGRRRKWPLNEYLPPRSMGLNGDHTGIQADHTNVHADPAQGCRRGAGARPTAAFNRWRHASPGIGLPRETPTCSKGLPLVPLHGAQFRPARRGPQVTAAREPADAGRDGQAGGVTLKPRQVVQVAIGAMVGARTPAQMDGWIGAASLRVTEEDYAAITEALRTTGAGSGPVEATRSSTP
jgi:hypothetical protein